MVGDNAEPVTLFPKGEFSKVTPLMMIRVLLPIVPRLVPVKSTVALEALEFGSMSLFNPVMVRSAELTPVPPFAAVILLKP